MLKKICVAASVVLLFGCGGDEAKVSFPDITPNDLSYSYPYHGQSQVSPSAPFVARFSDPIIAFDASGMSPAEVDVVLADLRAAIQAEVVWMRSSDAGPVSFSVSLVDNDPSEQGYNIDTLILTANGPLDLATEYAVDMTALTTEKGLANINVGSISYTTRGDVSGARSTSITDASFILEKLVPDGGELPMMDFSTLRLQFSQPLDQQTVVYGATVNLLDDTGALVPATVLVSGVKLSIDPIEDLAPGVTYQLQVPADALFSRFGDALAPVDMSLTPADSKPRSVLAQRSDASNADELLRCDSGAAGAVLSPLTGDAINCVPIRSVLLGDTTSSQTTGDVFAELAYSVNFPEALPLRISRGTLLSGASVDVLVAGHVPMLIDTDNDGETDTPLETGDITVSFISDANGYLLPNIYTQKSDEPRHVRLFLDVAMTAQTAEANGGLSQDLLHVEVVGTTREIDGKLVIEAIGVVEPRVLGLDDAFGLLSFHLESYEDPADAPSPVSDAVAPTLQSWVPGDRPDAVRPGDPVLINFSEPVDPASLAQTGAIVFQRNGIDAPFDWRLDGATLVVTPQTPLEMSGDGGNITYSVMATSLITDLAGNVLDDDYTLIFALPVYEGSGNHAAFATATYPGFPCAIASGTMDLANDDHGRCLGREDFNDADEHMPVTVMPENRAIKVAFSQSMDASSFALGGSCGAGTFRVEQVDNAGACLAVVPGELDLDERSLQFVPETPWQPGTLYRYVITSEEGFVPGDCGVSAVCTTTDYPVQTALLAGNSMVDGGPDMAIYFRGGPSLTAVYQALGNLPTSDINADFIHSATESQPDPDPDNAGEYLTPVNSTELALTSTGGLLDAANVGCGFVGRDAGDTWIGSVPAAQVCNDQKYVYLNGALSADVVGWNEGEGAIEVHVYPSIVMTTSIDNYAILNLVIARKLDLIPTGPQVMRIRYGKDDPDCVIEPCPRTRPVTGFIRETVEGPMLEIELQNYLDAPSLEPSLDLSGLGLGEIDLEHDLHSHELNLNLRGPVTLLPDGRMNIEQLNVVAADPIDVEIKLIGIDAARMTLEIPQGGINLNYISAPLKD